MSGDSEATSEQSSVHEGAGYDKVFPSSHGPEKGLSQSSEREPSIHSPVDEEEDYDGKEVEEIEGDEYEYDKGEGENEGELEGEDDEDEDESDWGSFYGGKFKKSRGWSYSSLHSSCDMDR